MSLGIEGEVQMVYLWQTGQKAWGARREEEEEEEEETGKYRCTDAEEGGANGKTGDPGQKGKQDGKKSCELWGDSERRRR